MTVVGGMVSRLPPSPAYQTTVCSPTKRPERHDRACASLSFSKSSPVDRWSPQPSGKQTRPRGVDRALSGGRVAQEGVKAIRRERTSAGVTSDAN